MASAGPTRNQRALELMREAIDSYVGNDDRSTLPALDEEASSLLIDLWAGQAAREGAFLLLALSLAEGRPLNLVDQTAGDLKTNPPRLAGDRALSEKLSTSILRPLGIPATKGVFQKLYVPLGLHRPADIQPCARAIRAMGIGTQAKP